MVPADRFAARPQITNAIGKYFIESPPRLPAPPWRASRLLHIAGELCEYGSGVRPTEHGARREKTPPNFLSSVFHAIGAIKIAFRWRSLRSDCAVTIEGCFSAPPVVVIMKVAEPGAGRNHATAEPLGTRRAGSVGVAGSAGLQSVARHRPGLSAQRTARPYVAADRGGERSLHGPVAAAPAGPQRSGPLLRFRRAAHPPRADRFGAQSQSRKAWAGMDPRSPGRGTGMAFR